MARAKAKSKTEIKELLQAEKAKNRELEARLKEQAGTPRPEEPTPLAVARRVTVRDILAVNPNVPCPKMPKIPGQERGWTSREQAGKALQKHWKVDLTVPEEMRLDTGSVQDKVPLIREGYIGDLYREAEQEKSATQMRQIFASDAFQVEGGGVVENIKTSESNEAFTPEGGTRQWQGEEGTQLVPKINVQQQYKRSFAFPVNPCARS